MNGRHRLANRRSHETVATEILNQRFKIGLGREVVCIDRAKLGPVAEVFINAQKPNSLLDTICNDGAILMSLLLQHGCPIDTIRHAMKRNPNGTPASPFGIAADLLNEDPNGG